MFILALGLAVVSPSFVHVTQTFKLKADAWNMAAVFRETRQEAVTSGKNTRIIINLADAKYWAYGSSPGCSTYRLSPGVAIAGTTFNRSANMVMCTFLPSGAPDSGGSVTLQNAGGKKMYVIVNPAVARIRVSDRPPENWN